MKPITEQNLRILAPHAKADCVFAFLNEWEASLAEFQITNDEVKRHILAHILVESAHLTSTEENLNYSAQRLTEVWPKRFPSIEAALPYAHNPQKLANKTYGGRNGNTDPNDGWTYRGQGILQTTFKSNFLAVAKKLGVTLADAMALVQNKVGMVRFAIATFVQVGAVDPAARGDLKGSTLRVNGGMNGYVDRQAAYKLVTAVLG